MHRDLEMHHNRSRRAELAVGAGPGRVDKMSHKSHNKCIADAQRKAGSGSLRFAT